MMVVPTSSNEGLAGKVAVITGGAGGIGRKVAEALEARGAKVYLLDLNKPSGDHDSRPFLACDVSSFGSVSTAINLVVAVAGRVDIAVGCAGVVSGTGLLDLDDDENKLILDVNLLGFINLLRAVVPPMQKQGGGKVVALGSVASRIGGVKSGPVYVAAKAGVAGVVKWAAKTYGPDGILVNAVAPGPVLTSMWEGLNGGQLEEDATGYPLGRLGRPEDIAEPIAFLAGPESNWITGQTLDINGGSYFS
ncbi:SDR family NAD(P)-dependent oxidoreductase [Microbacterium sp. A84]|uniref:SDR family NAD(P)-dependent oxidoreductase n=1 Tax=Microbacterium sp. A84 TaxID=3450715 RepID=UPI003F43D490